MKQNKKAWKMVRAAVDRMKQVIETENPGRDELEQMFSVWGMWIDCLYTRGLITSINRGYMFMELGDNIKKYAPQ